MNSAVKISLIVTTYNRSDALGMVLNALNNQSNRLEVLVADDGSSPETAAMLEEIGKNLDYPCRHVWQEDQGFRAAKIRNRVVAEAEGDYLIFLDGDCVPMPTFIERHRQLAEPGWWVTGNRILLSETFTQVALGEGTDLSQQSTLYWLQRRFWKDCNRLLPLLPLPLSVSRKWKPRMWKGAKTCNLGVWKSDFVKVNGFDESYEGWGYEDSDFVIRLIRSGVYRKSGRYALPVFHLWHPENDRGSEPENLARLQELLERSSKKSLR